MSRFRTRWLALVGAMLLIALSASSAFGAHPSHSDNRGNAVSSFVHSLLFGTDEEPEEQEEEGENEDEDENLDEDEQSEEVEEESEFRNHGHCVREVAWSLEVGGLNENHGGAVSEAARVTCWETDEEGDEGEAEEGVEGETESVETDDADASAGPGKSGQAHDRAPGKNKAEALGNNGKGQGHGRGGR
jgi:hypothetical protein